MVVIKRLKKEHVTSDQMQVLAKKKIYKGAGFTEVRKRNRLVRHKNMPLKTR